MTSSYEGAEGDPGMVVDLQFPQHPVQAGCFAEDSAADLEDTGTETKESSRRVHWDT